jgi:hypothetical protein
MSTRWNTLHESSKTETLDSDLPRYEPGGVSGLLSKVANGVGSI